MLFEEIKTKLEDISFINEQGEITQFKNVNIERWWAYDTSDLPAANIREVKFDTKRLDIKTHEIKKRFVILTHAKSNHETHTQELTDFYKLRNEVTKAVGTLSSFEISLLGGENIGDSAEFSFFGTALHFEVRCRKEIFEV